MARRLSSYICTRILYELLPITNMHSKTVCGFFSFIEVENWSENSTFSSSDRQSKPNNIISTSVGMSWSFIDIQLKRLWQNYSYTAIGIERRNEENLHRHTI